MLEAQQLEREFLAVGIFQASKDALSQAVREVLEGKGRGGYRFSEQSFERSRIYQGSPSRSGLDLKRAAVFRPGCAPALTALVSSLEDGWMTLHHVLARRLDVPVMLLRSSAPGDPWLVHDLHLWSPGGHERVVQLLDDGGHLVFYQKGTPLPFEDLTAYARRAKKDRLNRAMLLRYAEAFGLRIAEPACWEADGPALYIEELPAPAAP